MSDSQYTIRNEDGEVIILGGDFIASLVTMGVELVSTLPDGYDVVAIRMTRDLRLTFFYGDAVEYTTCEPEENESAWVIIVNSEGRLL